MFNCHASYGSSSRHSSGATGGGTHWVGVDLLETQECGKEKLNTSQVSLS
jgi:hypothetical protein